MSSGSGVVPCERTNRHGEFKVAFSNFVNAPKYTTIPKDANDNKRRQEEDQRGKGLTSKNRASYT